MDRTTGPRGPEGGLARDARARGIDFFLSHVLPGSLILMAARTFLNCVLLIGAVSGELRYHPRISRVDFSSLALALLARF